MSAIKLLLNRCVVGATSLNGLLGSAATRLHDVDMYVYSLRRLKAYPSALTIFFVVELSSSSQDSSSSSGVPVQSSLVGDAVLFFEIRELPFSTFTA